MRTILTIVLFSVLWSGALADCLYKGKTYPVGAFVTDNPCDHCTCLTSGMTVCPIIDCFYPMFSSFCPDGSLPVHKPGMCCPTCPQDPSVGV